MVVVGLRDNAGGIGFPDYVAEAVPSEVCASIRRGRVGGWSIRGRFGRRRSPSNVSEGTQPAQLFRTQLLRHGLIARKLRRLCTGLP